jgi:hypothetical protein
MKVHGGAYHKERAPTEADAGVQRLALSQLSDDLLVGFLRKSLERDGAQITL